MRIRAFEQADTEPVVALWEDCGLVRAWNDPRKDIARKLLVQPELFLVAEDDREIVGSAMVGYDGHRGWINYLAVSPAHQLRGIARSLMARAEHELVLLGCPKLNLQVRTENTAALGFYAALGYAHDANLSLSKRLIPDD